MHKLLILTFFLVAPAISSAQGRAQSWEFSVGGIYQAADTSGGQGGSALTVDDELGFGLNIGYFVSNNLNISLDLDFISPDYTATLITEPNPPDGSQEIRTLNHSLSQFNGRFKGTYYITDGPLVPYVEVGFGWTNVDSNVADGPPQSYCWWHPWWGYICESFVETFSSTETTYGGGIGLRYELPTNSFIKASYNNWTLDTGSGRVDPTLESYRLEFGWRF